MILITSLTNVSSEFLPLLKMLQACGECFDRLAFIQTFTLPSGLMQICSSLMSRLGSCRKMQWKPVRQALSRYKFQGKGMSVIWLSLKGMCQMYRKLLLGWVLQTDLSANPLTNLTLTRYSHRFLQSISFSNCQTSSESSQSNWYSSTIKLYRSEEQVVMDWCSSAEWSSAVEEVRLRRLLLRCQCSPVKY